jgi:hypothetical protein
MVSELEALLLGRPPIDAHAPAADQADQARRLSGSATAEAALALHPSAVRAARTLARSYQLLARDLAGR